MRIVVEGPDGSGKTSLVRELVKRYNLNKVVFNKDAKKSFDDYLQYLNLDNVVMDRSFMSELVYPEIFGRDHVLHQCEYDALLNVYNRNSIIIILNSTPEVLKVRLEERGDEFDFVIDQIDYISDKYNQIAEKLEVPTFDIRDLNDIFEYIESKGE